MYKVLILHRLFGDKLLLAFLRCHSLLKSMSCKTRAPVEGPATSRRFERQNDGYINGQQTALLPISSNQNLSLTDTFSLKFIKKLSL